MSRLTRVILSTSLLNIAAFSAVAETAVPAAPALPSSVISPIEAPAAPAKNTAIPTPPPAAPASVYNEPVKMTGSKPAATAADEELIYRASLGRAEDIKLLLEKNANPNVVDKNNVPVLFLAVNRKDTEAVNVVTALIDGGANVNTKDANGQTALYHAARNGNPEMVEYLLYRGIDYYSLDNYGDIARTLAFRAGHEKIVTLMDDFVKEQTAKTLELDRSGQAMSQAMSEAQRKRIALEEQKKRAVEEAKMAAERKKQEEMRRREEQKRIVEEKKRAAEEALRIKLYEENIAKMDEKVRAISFNACAFQYWSYVRDARQTIEPSKDQLNEILEKHKSAVESTSLDVMKMFETDKSYTEKIIEPSKKAIFDALEAMPSRTYRKQEGVGTLKDVQERCNKVADMWQVNKPKN